MAAKKYISICMVFAIMFSLLSVGIAESTSVDKDWLPVFTKMIPTNLSPETYSGFQMAIVKDQVDLNTIIPDKISEDGKVCYFTLSTKECKSFFEDAVPVSIGPNNTILWMRIVPSHEKELFAQKEHTIIPITQATNRGAADISETLKNELHYRFRNDPEPIGDSFRWSPDGRYIFFYDLSKWNGVMMAFVDPFLIDTVTGEIFLIETDGHMRFINYDGDTQYISDGRFSRDSQFFVYSLETRNKDGKITTSLKKYNLVSEEIEEIYQTENRLCDFCEMKADHWMIIESDRTGIYELARLSPDGHTYSCEREKINKPTGFPLFIPINEEFALLHAKNSQYFSSFIRIEWNKAIEDDKWYVIQDAVDEKMTAFSIPEVNKKADYANPRYWYRSAIDPQPITAPYTSCVTGTLINDQTTYLFMRYEYNREVPDTWYGMKEILHCIIALNAETFEMYPVIISGEDIEDFTDEVIYNNSLILGSESSFDAYQISYIGGGEQHWYNITQADETLLEGELYTCSNGSYLVETDSTPVKLSAYCVETENVEVDSIISATDDGFTITNTFTTVKDKPEYIVPLAISVERYKELTEKMSKKQKKQVSASYTLITAEKMQYRDDAQTLLEKYPKLADEDMYILKENIREEYVARLEGYFKEVGYSYDEYLKDLDNVVRSPALVTYFPVEYTFISEDKMSRTNVLLFAGLCDLINSAVYEQYYNSPPDETDYDENDLVGSILQSRQKSKAGMEIIELLRSDFVYNWDNYHVKITDVEETNGDLKITISVTIAENN